MNVLEKIHANWVILTKSAFSVEMGMCVESKCKYRYNYSENSKITFTQTVLL